MDLGQGALCHSEVFLHGQSLQWRPDRLLWSLRRVTRHRRQLDPRRAQPMRRDSGVSTDPFRLPRPNLVDVGRHQVVKHAKPRRTLVPQVPLQRQLLLPLAGRQQRQGSTRPRLVLGLPRPQRPRLVTTSRQAVRPPTSSAVRTRLTRPPLKRHPPGLERPMPPAVGQPESGPLPHLPPSRMRQPTRQVHVLTKALISHIPLPFFLFFFLYCFTDSLNSILRKFYFYT